MVCLRKAGEGGPWNSYHTLISLSLRAVFTMLLKCLKELIGVSGDIDYVATPLACARLSTLGAIAHV
jgi:hypothetical protein